MSNRPQHIGGAFNIEKMSQYQSYIPPMARAPVPGHIREQLRPSMPSQSQLASSQSNATQQVRTTQQGARGSFQKPPPNYQEALMAMGRTIHDQYDHPSQSQLQYGQRQTHVAEYGRLPPTITPPPPPPTPDIMATASFHMQHPSRPPPDYLQITSSSRSPLRLFTPQTGYGAAERGPPVHLPGRRDAAPGSPLPLSPTQQAEKLAFEINTRTGLNGFGAPSGYMPANFVDKIPGAWDVQGTLKWVPSWMREQR